MTESMNRDARYLALKSANSWIPVPRRPNGAKQRGQNGLSRKGLPMWSRCATHRFKPWSNASSRPLPPVSTVRPLPPPARHAPISSTPPGKSRSSPSIILPRFNAGSPRPGGDHSPSLLPDIGAIRCQKSPQPRASMTNRFCVHPATLRPRASATMGRTSLPP